MFFSNNKTILVPTDFTDAADQALAAACELAAAVGASIEVLHVDVDFPIAVVMPPDASMPLPVDVGESRAIAAEKLNVIAARIRDTGVRCSFRIGQGEPYIAIVERAAVIAAALIVVGSREHNALTRVLAGSVSESILRHSSCPLLVVPAKTREAAEKMPNARTESVAFIAQEA